ncbi:MAG: ANTAR domain-containing protein [Mycobacterium sp.]
MYQGFTYDQASGDREARTTIDLACGILIGLRGYTSDRAFRELVEVVHGSGVSLGKVAAALVALAAGAPGTDRQHTAAMNAWGALIEGSRVNPAPQAAH